MEGAQECDDVGTFRCEAGELDRGLDHFRAAVTEIGPDGAVDRRDAGELVADLGVDREIEIRRAEVDQVGGLLLDRTHDGGMRVAGRGNGNAGREIEEQIPVDVLDRQPLAPDRDDGVRPRQARRRPPLVERDVGPGLGTGDLGDDGALGNSG